MTPLPLPLDGLTGIYGSPYIIVPVLRCIRECSYFQVLANEYNALSLVMQYWTKTVPQWAWILVFWVIFLILSNLGILAYGEVEFWLALFVSPPIHATKID